MHSFLSELLSERVQGKCFLPMCMTFGGVGVEVHFPPQGRGEIQSRQHAQAWRQISLSERQSDTSWSCRERALRPLNWIPQGSSFLWNKCIHPEPVIRKQLANPQLHHSLLKGQLMRKPTTRCAHHALLGPAWGGLSPLQHCSWVTLPLVPFHLSTSTSTLIKPHLWDFTSTPTCILALPSQLLMSLGSKIEADRNLSHPKNTTGYSVLAVSWLRKKQLKVADFTDYGFLSNL